MPLLQPSDPAACIVLRGEAQSPCLLVCDHARNTVPQALGTLGIADAERLRHIGWDIGAEGVTRRLSAALDLTAVIAGYSRLVIDPNRQLNDPASIPVESDNTPIPGNQGISEADRAARQKAIFEPYHAAVSAELRRLLRFHSAPAVIAIHSFTPQLRRDGRARPWEIGVLYAKDDRLGRRLLRLLDAVGGLCVGDNEPYSGSDPQGFTLDHHAEREGFPNLAIELRQDLIADEAGQARWSDILAPLFQMLLADPQLLMRLPARPAP